MRGGTCHHHLTICAWAFSCLCGFCVFMCVHLHMWFLSRWILCAWFHSMHVSVNMIIFCIISEFVFMLLTVVNCFPCVVTECLFLESHICRCEYIEGHWLFSGQEGLTFLWLYQHAGYHLKFYSCLSSNWFVVHFLFESMPDPYHLQFLISHVL